MFIFVNLLNEIIEEMIDRLLENENIHEFQLQMWKKWEFRLKIAIKILSRCD